MFTHCLSSNFKVLFFSQAFSAMTKEEVSSINRKVSWNVTKEEVSEFAFYSSDAN